MENPGGRPAPGAITKKTLVKKAEPAESSLLMKTKSSNLTRQINILAASIMLVTTVRAQTIFTDNFNAGASPEWSNSRGAWMAAGGVYYATVPNNIPPTFTGLPFVLQNFAIDVDINQVADGGIWLRCDATGTNGVLLVTGGHGWGSGGRGGNAGQSLYWHVLTPANWSNPQILNEAFNVFTNPGVENVHLRVEVDGNHYSAFLNGSSNATTTLIETNNTYSTGHVGLYDFSSQTFDNFVLQIPSGFATDCTPTPSDLVSWWPGDGNANDIQGANNGSLGGVKFVPGEVNQAFHFDGSSWVTTSNETNLSFDRTNAFSIDAWIRTTNASGNMFVVAKRQEVAPFNGYAVMIDNGQVPKCYATDPTPPGAGWLQILLDGSVTSDCPRDHAIIVYGKTSVNDGLWHHIAATYDGSSTAAGVALYVDGVVQTNLVIADTLGANSITNSEGFAIGAGSGNGPQPFSGDIDEIDVFNRVLSPAEIQAIVNAGTAGKCMLLMRDPQLSGTNFTFNLPTASNQTYTVQQNSNLATTNWQFFQTITGNGSLKQFLVPTTNAQNFFRLKQP